jgi:glycosyltransferase involved in cell wall biosynthesis
VVDHLIYYYPSKNGAPSTVGRCLFDSLTKKEINFDLLVFLQNKKEKIKGKEKGKKENIKFVSVKELFYLKNGIIHLSMSPLIYPNNKFLLYVLSFFNQSKLIINYHGETRTEFKIKLVNHDIQCLFNLPTYILTPLILKNADIIVVNSFVMKNLFEARYKLSNIKVIPNAIDTFWFTPEMEESYKIDIKGTFRQSINIFYHGRLAPEKGVDILLKGFSNVIKKYESMCKTNHIMLYIAGEGPQREYLKNLSLNLEIAENVIFLGKIPLENLKIYLQSVDAAIYPSIYEPFSLAVLEALSSVNGPVMYSNNIGINDFVKRDGYLFYTFEPSVEGISNAIESIIEKKYDINIYNEQKKFSRKYSWDNIADEYLKLYNQLL